MSDDPDLCMVDDCEHAVHLRVSVGPVRIRVCESHLELFRVIVEGMGVKVKREKKR